MTNEQRNSEKMMNTKWNYRRLSRPSSKSFCEELRFVSIFKLTAGGRLVKSEWWLGIAFVAVDGDDAKFVARKYGDVSKLFAYAKLLWFFSWVDWKEDKGRKREREREEMRDKYHSNNNSSSSQMQKKHNIFIGDYLLDNQASFVVDWLVA